MPVTLASRRGDKRNGRSRRGRQPTLLRAALHSNAKRVESMLKELQYDKEHLLAKRQANSTQHVTSLLP